MEYSSILLTTLLSIVILMIFEKAEGNRTIATMTMYDYTNSIAMGSLAAQLAIAKKEEITFNIIAMVVYGVFTFACALITNKSRKVRKIMEGHPVILMEKGKLFKNNMKKARIDMDELMANLRTMGYFELSQIDTVIMEITGNISVIPIADEKAVTAMDLGLKPKKQLLPAVIINDGEILHENLHIMGKNEKWLEKQITQHKKNLKNILIATVDEEDTIHFFESDEAPKVNKL